MTDDFFNTSLGMAAQRSYGAGILLDKDCRNSDCQFGYGGSLDFCYLSERFYSAAPALGVYGPRFEEHISYRTKSKRSDALKPNNLILSEDVWVNPVNNLEALQWRAQLSITKPLSRHICPGITAENNYIENVPQLHKKNYTAVTIQLTVTGGSNPAQRCY